MEMDMQSSSDMRQKPAQSPRGPLVRVLGGIQASMTVGR